MIVNFVDNYDKMYIIFLIMVKYLCGLERVIMVWMFLGLSFGCMIVVFVIKLFIECLIKMIFVGEIFFLLLLCLDFIFKDFLYLLRICF